MDKEFDFNKVGKKMPYKVPGSFLEDFSDNFILKSKEGKRGRKGRMNVWRISLAAASVIIILFTGLLLNKGKDMPVINFNDTIKSSSISEKTEVEKIIQELTDDELILLSTMMNSDIFNE